MLTAVAGETESILQHLRAIDAQSFSEGVAKDVREIKTRVGTPRAAVRLGLDPHRQY